MERRWVGESIPLSAAFTDPATGVPLVGVSGVTFVLQLEDGTSVREVSGLATSQAHVFTAWVTVPGVGIWEAQARCTAPVVGFSGIHRFEGKAPLHFAAP